MLNFTTTTGNLFQNVKNGFWVDHYYDKKRLSMFWFYLWRQKNHNVENQNINYLWHITKPGGLDVETNRDRDRERP